jgi:hypothetical protein
VHDTESERESGEMGRMGEGEMGRELREQALPGEADRSEAKAWPVSLKIG